MKNLSHFPNRYQILGKSAFRQPAAELKGLVVTGVALDRVASQHTMPPYPLDARSQRIQGEVRVRIQVENGKMLNVTAKSKSLTLANSSARWIQWHWKFRPSVSGVYYLPISFKMTA